MSNDPSSSGLNSEPFSTNPYAPTSHISEAHATTSEAEAYRKAYLNHEASVKSVGALYMLGALFLVPIGLGLAVWALANEDPTGPSSIEAVVGLCCLAYGVFQGFVAVGLRRLQSWARIAAAVISVVGLLAGLIGLRLGALISAYVLYLVLSEKGQIVFSENYKRIIEQTPHIQYRTSIIIWLFVGLLFALFFLGLGAALFDLVTTSPSHESVFTTGGHLSSCSRRDAHGNRKART